jgi:hypothetical protein
VRTKLAAVLLLLCGPIPVRAGVIVLANRTDRVLKFTPAGSPEQSIPSFDQAVLYVDGGITISFASAKETKTYRLQPDAAYFFADLPSGGVALQGIGAAGGDTGSVTNTADGHLVKPPPLETIPVRIFVDEEEPAARPAWEARLRKRIASASAVLERTCRVRLEVAEAGTWNSDNQASDLPALLTDFERKLPRGNSRLLIGFTSQRTAETDGVLHLGGTRVPLHPYILMREWTPPTEPGRLEVLLHELGHYLGAVHSPEPISVMRPKLGDGRVLSVRFPVGYDPLNTLAMNLVANEIRTRAVRSLRQLSEPTKERLRQIYREVQTADAADPVMAGDPTPEKFLTLLGPPPPKPEAPKPDIPKPEPAKPDTPKTDVAKMEPPKAEPPKPEPAKSDTPKTEVAKIEQAKAEPPKEELPKPEPKAEPPKAEAPPEPAPRDKLVDGARTIVAAIVRAAEKNQALPDRSTPGTAPPFRRSGDALTDYYVREAAAAAKQLPRDEAAPAFLVGASVALDTADLFRKNPVTGPLWRTIESNAERDRRLKVLGSPTIFNRHDSCQHCFDSAALVAVRGVAAAELAGVLKELLDSQKGGSGFSFADLASDMSGVAFGRWVLANPDRLAKLAESFSVADFAVPPDGLVEGLTYEQFSSQFGSVADQRFKDEQDKLRKRVRDLPAYRAPAPPAPVERRQPEKPSAAKESPKEPVEKQPAEKAPPSEKTPAKPPQTEKPAEEKEEEPAPVRPRPSYPPAPIADSRSLSGVPLSVLAPAGVGLISLASAAFVLRPSRKARAGKSAGAAPVLFGSTLALAGLVLLGGAYARWTWPADESPTSSGVVTSDLDPAWSRAPLDPFEIPTLRVIRLPAGAGSMSGAIGSDGQGHVWFAISAGSETEPSARVLEYDPESARTTPRGDVLAELRKNGLFQSGDRQATIRTRLARAADGNLYFASTDDVEGGSKGSHLWRIRPADGTWDHLLTVPERLVATASAGRYVYALGHPGHVVYQYNCTTDATSTTQMTRVGSVEGQFSNNILGDGRGHVFVPRIKSAADGVVQTLVEFNQELHEIAETPLDAAGPVPRGNLHGLVAVQPLADHSAAFVTDRGNLYRVASGEGEQPAKVAPLGSFHPRGESYVVALFSPDGVRYLMGLARRQAWRDAPYDWLVHDLQTGRSVVVPVPAPEEDGRALKELLLAGSMTRDDKGRFYIGGSQRRNGLESPVFLQVSGPK